MDKSIQIFNSWYFFENLNDWWAEKHIFEYFEYNSSYCKLVLLFITMNPFVEGFVFTFKYVRTELIEIINY